MRSSFWLLSFFFWRSLAQSPQASCKVLGCGTFKRSNPCQCNSRCQKYNDCCADYKTTCGSGPSPGPSPSPHPHPTPIPADSCDVNKGPASGPEQLHLALGDTPETMTVTFATSSKYTQTPACTVEGLGNFTGSTRTYKDGNWNGLIHTVTFKGLQP